MRALYSKLYDYLSDEYPREEIEKALNDVRIRKISSDYVEVVWSSGILERLRLDDNGKLESINDKLERTNY